MARTRRGFTLIELMVALTGSLMFTIFVFMLSRQASSYFQGQARLSETTLATISGFERLRSDIARAGYLASPNLARDKNRCPRNASGSAAAPQQSGGEWSGYPALQEMGLLRIIPTAASDYLSGNVTLEENGGGILPDKLVLYGNYTTAEQFPIERIVWGSPVQLILEQNSVALQRAGVLSTTTDVEATTILSSIFRGGQLLRLVDTTGREQYALTDTISVNTGKATIELDTGINLLRKNSSSALCGVRSVCTGCLINPVDIIRYEIVDKRMHDDAQQAHLDYLYDGLGPDYDQDRLDLYRYHLTPGISNGADVEGNADIGPTAELIAEYAVDLKFGLTVTSNTTDGTQTEIAEGAYASLANYAGIPFDSPTNGVVTAAQTFGPHFIRGVWARLNVRNREADRDAPIIFSDTATSSQLYRVRVRTGDSGQGRRDTFARMRTLRSHIATRNTQNLMWN